MLAMLNQKHQQHIPGPSKLLWVDEIPYLQRQHSIPSCYKTRMQEKRGRSPAADVGCGMWLLKLCKSGTPEVHRLLAFPVRPYTLPKPQNTWFDLCSAHLVADHLCSLADGGDLLRALLIKGDVKLFLKGHHDLDLKGCKFSSPIQLLIPQGHAR